MLLSYTVIFCFFHSKLILIDRNEHFFVLHYRLWQSCFECRWRCSWRWPRPGAAGCWQAAKYLSFSHGKYWNDKTGVFEKVCFKTLIFVCFDSKMIVVPRLLVYLKLLIRGEFYCYEHGRKQVFIRNQVFLSSHLRLIQFPVFGTD